MDERYIYGNILPKPSFYSTVKGLVHLLTFYTYTYEKIITTPLSDLCANSSY